MTKGWFDAFRTDGGPTLYSFANRTPVIEDVQTIIIYLTFVSLFVAFLIIFPGIRKEKLSTFISVTLSLFVGAVILLCNYGSSWHVAQAKILSPYRAFSREKIPAQVGVYIGLNSVNITLKALPESNLSGGIDYNERFFWTEATDFKEGYRDALEKGLPFPILTVAEYLSLGSEGFCWGSSYRTAGYYSFILLWTSFAIWLLMNVLFCVVPRYGAYTMVLTGLLQLLTTIIYYANLPVRPLVVPFEGSMLRFRLGWCYWLVLVTGCLCVIVGIIIAVIDLIYPHKFSTVLEVDYDTPYDRHIILQDNSKPKASSKQKSGIEVTEDTALAKRFHDSNISSRRRDLRDGISNQAFETDITSDKPSSSSSSWRTANNLNQPKGNTSPRLQEQKQDVNIDVQSAAMW